MEAFVTIPGLPLRVQSKNVSYCNRVARRIAVCQQEAPPRRQESSAMNAAAATFILKKAAEAHIKGTRRPNASSVSSALLQLEREQKRNKVQTDIEKLFGQWRLIFTLNPKTKNPLTKALYFPLRAHQSFLRAEDGTVNEGVFDNGIFWFNGAANFRLSGPMRWTPRRSRMEFTVDRLTVKLGSWNWATDGLDKEGSSLEGRTAKTLPFFTFFAIRSDVACARGRSGGLALYARVPDDERL